MMPPVLTPVVASAITKAASVQTYYTIRLLADRDRVQDAFRAYAYFRWVDDVLDAEGPTASSRTGTVWAETPRLERVGFAVRQRSLLEQCLRGDPAATADPHERMLVDLVRHAGPADGGLEAYLRNMMLVMEFDASRRGRLVSQADLDAYTTWLAVAVTEGMHHFIGHGDVTPGDETRYSAVSGAHVLHMLRDTFIDLRAGYFNVPREMLEAHGIGPEEVFSDPYRSWVAERVEVARAYLDGGKAYFGRIPSPRHRLAGLAYIARFEWLMDAIKKDGFRLRPGYDEAKSTAAGLRMACLTAARMVWMRGVSWAAGPVAGAGGP